MPLTKDTRNLPKAKYLEIIEEINGHNRGNVGKNDHKITMGCK
jgi:hypothetical protein